MIKVEPIHRFSDPFISAASGLAMKDGYFFIVADDENFAAKIDKSNLSRVKLIRLFPGELPKEKAPRKLAKPDLESLTPLPSGHILCVPSGSELNRCRGVIIGGDDSIRAVRFGTLYEEIRKTFPELNIEGAVAIGQHLRLFQRGNGKKNQNGIIDVSLKDFLDGEVNIVSVKHLDLGMLNGANLSFTDATVFENLIYFLAVAEASESTFLDGEIKGSGLGAMNFKGEIVGFKQLDLRSKPEGLCMDSENFYIVTDDDDRTKPSLMYKGSRPQAAEFIGNTGPAD